MIKAALESVNAASGKKSITVSASSGSTNQTVEAKSTGNGATPVVDFKLAGVPALKQPSPLSCWAVALTMLVSHARKQSLPVETVLLMGGEEYVQRFRNDTGLPINELRSFRTDFQLNDVSFGALTATDLEAALRQHGPLWVIADEDSSLGFSVRARVMTGVVGDGTPAGTKILFNDPATGSPDDEPLNTFTQKLDQLSQGVRSAFGGVSPTVLAL